MSKKYDEYLASHTSAVLKAAQYMVEIFGETNVFDGVDADEFIASAIEHDRSKYEPDEYGPYDAYFYGERDLDAFNKAWLLHIHRNPHHWQHWLLMNDDGKYRDPGKVVPLEMPKERALEMIADWWSFSWRSGNLKEMLDWYDGHRDSIVLHEKTRDYVETTLDRIAEHLKSKEGVE